MNGYKIFNYEREVLIRQRMNNGTFYNPVKDINGDYFIFEKEYEQCGLGELTGYTPPPQEEI